MKKNSIENLSALLVKDAKSLWLTMETFAEQMEQFPRLKGELQTVALELEFTAEEIRKQINMEDDKGLLKTR